MFRSAKAGAAQANLFSNKGYNRLRFCTYRRFFDYSGGFITDFGGHRLDSVHQIMHDDNPLTAMGVGGLFASKSIVDTPNVLHVTYEYKDFILSYEGIQLNGFGTGPRMPGGAGPMAQRGPSIGRMVRHFTEPKERYFPTGSATNCIRVVGQAGNRNRSRAQIAQISMSSTSSIASVQERTRPRMSRSAIAPRSSPIWEIFPTVSADARSSGMQPRRRSLAMPKLQRCFQEERGSLGTLSAEIRTSPVALPSSKERHLSRHYGHREHIRVQWKAGHVNHGSGHIIG